ncbi:cytochrome b/b6 domain-containing protein [Shewanella sp. 3B26]|uniref:Cytochrome b/b6 domain-containing protein n=1 Tax=Shewanella zhuhaiensis TaxID=2919576 RepID=A0AAJ1FC47_9GAMM|nr:cytochrome b/b6 domain-containing protein [Shewanella zhuhaiensis]MCH4295610.1 cytochrome b/b6 domain-containing protein [Shewanella zhuhaiensis]
MQEKKYVWDIFVRTFHWSLVIAFVVSYVSGDELQSLHVASGYFILGLILMRLVWGFIGTRHARFSDFVRSPVAAFGYLKGLVSGDDQGAGPRYEGHNPAGGLMVLMLLASILATGFSGLKILGYEGEGPFAQTGIAQSDGNSQTEMAQTGIAQIDSAPTLAAQPDIAIKQPAAGKDDDDDDHHQSAFGSDGHNRQAYASVGDYHDHEGAESEAEEFWEEIHEFFVNFTLLLVILHVGGVFLSSRAHGENLVKAMVTGYKGEKD